MAEIEITLPTVQYGNVKIKGTPEELGIGGLGDAHAIGMSAAVYVNLFTQGFKMGAALDVGPPQAASQGVSEAQAQRYLDEGLGGVTEVSEGGLNQHPDDGPEESDDAPWNSPAVDTPKKPWETGEAPAKPVVSDEW